MVTNTGQGIEMSENLIECALIGMWKNMDNGETTIDPFSYLIGLRAGIGIGLDAGDMIEFYHEFELVMEQCAARLWYGETPGKWS